MASEKLPLLRPDISFVCYLSNDIEPADVYSFTRRDDTIAKWALLSPAANYLYARFVKAMDYRERGAIYFGNLLHAYLDRDRLARHKEELARLLGIANGYSVHTVFVLLPFPSMWMKVRPEVRRFVYEEIKNVPRAMGVPIIDLTGIEERYSLLEFQVSYMDAHPNERMHKRIAKGIHSWLLTQPFMEGLVSHLALPFRAVAARKNLDGGGSNPVRAGSVSTRNRAPAGRK